MSRADLVQRFETFRFPGFVLAAFLTIEACSPDDRPASDATVGPDADAARLEGAWERLGPDAFDLHFEAKAPDADAVRPDMDVPHPDADVVGPACPPHAGQSGCPCQKNMDCASGWCVFHLGDKVCTVGCTSDCPVNWTCKQEPGVEELEYVCLSKFPSLCLPCQTHDDCSAAGAGVCVTFDAGAGSFCSAQCDDESPCPEAYQCAAVNDVNGPPLAACVPASGECPCTEYAMQTAARTTCYAANEFGTCSSVRSCTPEGLTPCLAKTPAADTCDGLDNDCNASADDGVACDDGDPCTEDQCQGADGCKFTPTSGGSCTDGDECTANDECGAGVCVGQPLLCPDDDDPCTTEVCVAGQCSHPAGNEGGGCPDDGNQCTTDVCSAGECVHPAAVVGTFCDDGNDCTGGDFCWWTSSCSGSAFTGDAGCDELSAACGDGACVWPETAFLCPQDCGSCGDGVCGTHENGLNGGKCPMDCVNTCGDGKCQAGETAAWCKIDCSECGDGLCGLNESAAGCPADCPITCGNGYCGKKEDWLTCAADCPLSCGNGICSVFENVSQCQTDCTTCGDGFCGLAELGSGACPQDCGYDCGNGICQELEGYVDCPVDCGFCGDGFCGYGESGAWCGADCAPGCGDGEWQPLSGESADSCPQDCVTDKDDDAVPDAMDNCPSLANPDQADSDADLAGDACDPDDDSDLEGDATDCQPLDPSINHLAQEVCDGHDDDCDGEVDEQVPCPTGSSCTGGACQVVCGDGLCGPGESFCNCVEDCGKEGCAGCCQGTLCLEGVTDEACGKDNATCQLCEAGKTCVEQVCKAACGDGACAAASGETCLTCPEDCGGCGSLTPGFVKIEGGSFWMGSPAGGDEQCPVGYTGGGCTGDGIGTTVAEPGRSSDEKLRHVTLTHDFEMQIHEVTRGEWMAATGGEELSFVDYASCGDECGEPMRYISWSNACAFANLLSKKAGLAPCYVWETPYTIGLSQSAWKSYDCEGYRLPTEAEWEYAARAGSVTPFYPSQGNDGGITQASCSPVDANLDQIGWYAGNSSALLPPGCTCGDYGCECPLCEPHEVAMKEPNAWGLYDMSGNVEEWVWHRSCYLFEEEPGNDPDSENCAGKEYWATKRGGGWESPARHCRSAARRDHSTLIWPEYATGLRVARTIGFSKLVCGNGVCGDASWETCSTCPGDCGACCPNGLCDNGESCDSCPSDCGSCAAVSPGFVRIAAGSYWMGSPAGQLCPVGYKGAGCNGLGGGVTEWLGISNGGHLHYVTLTHDFEMQAHEITQGEWKSAFPDWNPWWDSECGDACPIAGINWYDVCAYANVLSAKAGLAPCYVFKDVYCSSDGVGPGVGSNYSACFELPLWGIENAKVSLPLGVFEVSDCVGFRMPTQAEWEYAARAGSLTAYHPSPGNDGISKGQECEDPNLDQIGWYMANASTAGWGSDLCWDVCYGPPTCGPQPVGGKEANAWGLYDMCGNVWEWTWDKDCGEATDGPALDPDGGDCGSSDRIIRGGSWGNYASNCGTATALSLPEHTGDEFLGSRLARTIVNRCGDGDCGPGEDKCNCLADCSGGCDGCCDGAVCKKGGKNAECGVNGDKCDVCTGGKTCQDHACAAKCGDGTCAHGAGETCKTCSKDCGPCGGDSFCEGGETCQTSPADCGSCGATPGFVTIQAGSFWMGSPAGGSQLCPVGYLGGGCAGNGAGKTVAEKGRDNDENLHRVKLTHDFEMQVHEVTQWEWRAALAGWNPSSHPECGESCPVESINWYDAVAFANVTSQNAGLPPCYLFSEVVCEDGSKQAGDYKECLNGTRMGISSATVTLSGPGPKSWQCKGFRLPTEAEWEYAARAGSETAFHPSPGNDGSITQILHSPLDPNLDQIGWYGGNSVVSYENALDCSAWYPGATFCGPHPVVHKDGNAWGLYDMSGNVSEWCWDCYGYDAASYGDDPDGKPSGENCIAGVGRGGSWFSESSSCRAAARDAFDRADRALNRGLRLARTAGGFCLDGTCDPGENICNCPQDCPTACDGCCEAGACSSGMSKEACGMDGASCVACTEEKSCQDRECIYLCGDQICAADGGETHLTCPKDCPPGCPNGLCDLDEAWETCPADCPPTCPNGVCDQGETCETCVADCLLCCPNGLCNLGETWETCPADWGTIGETPGFMKIMAGTFWMGSPNGETCPVGYVNGQCSGDGSGKTTKEPGRDSDESLHEVTLTRDFEMMVHEVTQGEWQAATAGWNPAAFAACGNDCPAENVSWYDACAFANLMSTKLGYAPCYEFVDVTCKDGASVGPAYQECLNDTNMGIGNATLTLSGGAIKPYECAGFRLPTEAEWEYAARAGSQTAFYPASGVGGSLTQSECNPVDPSLDMLGWYCGNSGNTTHAAGLKQMNGNGIADMAGNVWEWCWDRFCPDYQGPAVDPDSAACDASFQVTRGGSWLSPARNCRNAERAFNLVGKGYNTQGFRLVRTLGN